MNRIRVDLLQGGPEPQGAVTDGQPGPHRQAPLLEIAQDVQPGGGGLAQPVADGHPLLGPVGGNADDDQQAQTRIVGLAQGRIDAVDPPAGVLPVTQVAARPPLR